MYRKIAFSLVVMALMLSASYAQAQMGLMWQILTMNDAVAAKDCRDNGTEPFVSSGAYGEKSTMQLRLERMQTGAMSQGGDCPFASRDDLEIVLLALETKMSNSPREDVQRGAKYIKAFQEAAAWMVLYFVNCGDKYCIKIAGADSGPLYELWFDANGDSLAISSFWEHD